MDGSKICNMYALCKLEDVIIYKLCIVMFLSQDRTPPFDPNWINIWDARFFKKKENTFLPFHDMITCCDLTFIRMILRQEENIENSSNYIIRDLGDLINR